MTLQRVTTVLDGIWIELSRHLNYHIVEVYVSCSCSFQGFVECIQGILFSSSIFSCLVWPFIGMTATIPTSFRLLRSRICLGMLVLSKFSDNDLLVVVDSVLTRVVGSTLYLNSEVLRSQNSHHYIRRLLTLMPLNRCML